VGAGHDFGEVNEGGKVGPNIRGKKKSSNEGTQSDGKSGGKALGGGTSF